MHAFYVRMPDECTWQQVTEAIQSCAICERAHRFPINQCPNGHIYCRSCFRRSGSCPSCRVDVTHLHRNLLADSIADGCGIPLCCRWDGCDFAGSTRDREQHEERCELKSVKCHLCGCWPHLRDLLMHYCTAHSAISSTGRNRVHSLQSPVGMEQASVVLLPSEEATATEATGVLVSPPPIVVHFDSRDQPSSIYSVWAQGVHGPDAAWEVDILVESSVCRLSCTCPVRPILSPQDTMTRPRAPPPRVDLSPSGTAALLTVHIKAATKVLS